MSPPAIPYVATVTASAQEAAHPAWGALVHDDRKRWCVPDGVGATLTVTFDRPLVVGEVWMMAGSDDAKAAGARDVQLATDARTVAAKIDGGDDTKEVAIGGAPTRTLTLKIAAISASADDSQRTCLTELQIRGADRTPVPLLLGVPPAAAAALPDFLRDLDAGLAGCDAAAIARTVAFPLALTMHVDVRPADRKPKRDSAMKLASARALADMCANDGRMIALGYAARFDGDLSSAAPAGPALVHVGEATDGLRLAWKDRWRVTAVDLHDPTFRHDGWGDEPGPIELWIAKLHGANVPSFEETAADALFVGLDARSAVLAQKEFAAAADNLDDPAIERTTGARGRGAGWMVLDTRVRVSAMFEIAGDRSVVVAAFVSSPHSGKPGAMAPLPALTRDTTLRGHPDVVAAVDRLVKGPIDRVAASRPDLIAIGVGPDDTIVGGDKVAAMWRSRWAGKLTVTGVVGRVAATGNTAFVVIDATRAKTAYRIAVVLDKTAAGAWSLGHVHIAAP